VLPQLGSDIEIIETANPRTFYDLTRRKLGLVLGVEPNPETEGTAPIGHNTSLPNVFIVSDTVTAAATMDAVVESALALANHLSG
jgi:phytoene dehydrogenase-like protein